MLLRHSCRFWQQCRTKFRPFDKVETNLTCSVCIDFVYRTKFYDTRSTLLPFVATKSNVASTKWNVASTMLPVASTLLLVWTEPNTGQTDNALTWPNSTLVRGGQIGWSSVLQFLRDLRQRCTGRSWWTMGKASDDWSTGTGPLIRRCFPPRCTDNLHDSDIANVVNRRRRLYIRVLE